MNWGLDRGNTSIVARWWCTTDRVSFFAIGGLILCGVLLTLAATPPVAERLGLDHLHFVRRQLTLIPLAVCIVILLSMLSLKPLKLFASGLFILALIATAVAGLWGAEIKGAQRWLSLGGLSIQPSEFLKPAFAVISAWVFDHSLTKQGQPLNGSGILLLAAVQGALIQQPDFGMFFVIATAWTGQFFVAGATATGIGIFLILGGLCGILAYQNLPHVTARIDGFFGPHSANQHQIEASLRSFAEGGLFGRGPGEGLAKQHLPDAHADFIFAVAGEEFGFLFCLTIIFLYMIFVMRGFKGAMRQQDRFAMLAATGLVSQIGLQALINMGSTLHVIPAKGMTLPFISYGGSSLLATAIAFGLVLAFTRHRFDPGVWR